VLDSSLDIDGLDFLLQSLAETDEPNCCNIIISHRPEIKENTLFDKILTLSKENGFSKIKSVSYE
jgi:DNA repair exonuclease SbcCD ATPase subunit